MDKWNIKGQGALEFIILVGLLLFIFIIILGIAFANLSDTNRKRDELIGEDLVTKVQKEINLAARVLDGYSRQFSIPEKLSNRDFTITIINNRVIVNIGGEDYWRILPPVVGDINKGQNTINRTNGIIYLN